MRVRPALAALAIFAFSSTIVRADAPSIVGWANGPAIAQELSWEHQAMALPSAQNAMAIEEHLSSVPHRAGSPADRATALFVQHRLEADGFTTRVQPYDVWFTGPVEQRLEIVAPHHHAFDLLEGAPGHHSKWEMMAGPAFLENSGDGDVSGAVYYVDHANKADLAELDAAGVNLKGAVVVIRLGGQGGGAPQTFDPSFNTYNELTKRGVVAVLEFFDPGTGGFGGGDTWPHGNYKNLDMAERMGGPAPGSFFTDAPGDATLPGQAPLPGVAHKPFSDVPHATIPEMSITERVARELLQPLGGKTVPSDWHPMFEFAQHYGGNERVHVHVRMTRHLATIWNVFGDIKGSEDPDSIVMIGSHRDAMTFGAIDPGSGTTVMMQDADAFHALTQKGWHPKRTIEIASWDGHELGLYGSISYAYQDGANLRAHVFQYINTDQLTTGYPYIVSASPGLYAFNKQIADTVTGPDGKPLSAGDRHDRPLLNPVSGGSDHQTFAYMLGVPSTTNGFYGSFGAHHTAEDNIDGLRTYDPGMKEAVAMAQVNALQAMRAAGATVSPLRIEEEPTQLLKDLKRMEPILQGKTDDASLVAALNEFQTAAHAIDVKMEAAEAGGDATTMLALARKEQASRDALFMPDGLAFNKYEHTIDRVLAAFPEIAFAGSDQQTLKTAVQRATAAMSAAAVALK